MILRNGTRVEISEAGETRVTLPGGAAVDGSPQGVDGVFDAGQVATAERLGYGGDVVAMVREHDPLHAALTDWIGMSLSYALAHAAGQLPAGGHEVAAAEEDAVLAVQRLMRISGRSIEDVLP